MKELICYIKNSIKLHLIDSESSPILRESNPQPCQAQIKTRWNLKCCFS